MERRRLTLGPRDVPYGDAGRCRATVSPRRAGRAVEDFRAAERSAACSDCNARLELQVSDVAELEHFLVVIRNDELFRQAVADAKRRATM